MSPISITLLSGWLGAGKTTLLNRLLAQADGRRIAVMQNEFGSAGIDGDLVETTIAGLYELSGGCLCCTVHDDFLAILEDLIELVDPPKHVVIETSGVADPTTILFSLLGHPWCGERFDIDGVVSVVDAAEFARTLREVPEAAPQVAAADLVIVNKIDLVDRLRPDPIRSLLVAINPEASIVFAEQADPSPFDPTDLGRFDAGRIRMLASADASHEHSLPIDLIEFDDEARYDGDRIVDVCGDIASTFGDELYRMKGIVMIDGSERPLLVQGVRSRFTFRFLDRQIDRSRLVLIGRSLDRGLITRQVASARTPLVDEVQSIDQE